METMNIIEELRRAKMIDDEILAMRAVSSRLSSLPSVTRGRVIAWLVVFYNIDVIAVAPHGRVALVHDPTHHTDI